MRTLHLTAFLFLLIFSSSLIFARNYNPYTPRDCYSINSDMVLRYSCFFSNDLRNNKTPAKANLITERLKACAKDKGKCSEQELQEKNITDDHGEKISISDIADYHLEYYSKNDKTGTEVSRWLGNIELLYGNLSSIHFPLFINIAIEHENLKAIKILYAARARVITDKKDDDMDFRYYLENASTYLASYRSYLALISAVPLIAKGRDPVAFVKNIVNKDRTKTDQGTDKKKKKKIVIPDDSDNSDRVHLNEEETKGITFLDDIAIRYTDSRDLPGREECKGQDTRILTVNCYNAIRKTRDWLTQIVLIMIDLKKNRGAVSIFHSDEEISGLVKAHGALMAKYDSMIETWKN